MGKISRRSIVMDVYRKLIVSYHRRGKDSETITNRLKELAIRKKRD